MDIPVFRRYALFSQKRDNLVKKDTFRDDADGEGECWGEGKGLRSTDWQLQNSPGDGRYTQGTVSNLSI